MNAYWIGLRESEWRGKAGPDEVPILIRQECVVEAGKERRGSNERVEKRVRAK